MKRRSRSRSRKTQRGADSRRYLLALVVLGAGVVLLGTVFNTAAFSLVDLNRSGDIDVVDDGSGALTLDHVSAVNVGNRERLVTMTNRLNQSATVTVSITSGSGTLYTGSQSGSSVSFSLSRAASRTVDVEAGGTGSDTIEYEIHAVGTGVDVTIPRSVETLSSGEAAPGYPGAFNDIDYPPCSSEEAYENNTIPPGCSAPGEVSNFPNMQVASDGGAFAEIDSREDEGGTKRLDVGVVMREVPDVSQYELKLRHSYASWAANPTVNIVDASGNVLQSKTLVHTDDVMEVEFIELNSAANSFVASNDVAYVTFTGGSNVQLDVDYLRIQEKTPPPDASFTHSCSGRDCTFDASTSSGYGQALVSYTWTFGDGNTTTTSSSVISHEYATNGSYNVKLTVENTAGETDSTTDLITVGTPSPSLIPADVYDDIEHWENDPEAEYEDNDIPPPQPQGNKLTGDFEDTWQYDGSYVTLEGNPMDIGFATLGVSDQGSSYALKIRHAQHSYEGKVEVLLVDANNSVLQSHQLAQDPKNDFINTTIQFNAAAEAHVKNTGDVYVRFHKTTGGWVDLQIDAFFVEVTP